MDTPPPHPPREPEAGRGPLLITPSPSRAGEVLGERFELIQQIAKGGMGFVYLAHDRQLPWPVAVKILATRDPAIEQRFLDEAEILSTLSHPNLVRPLGQARTAGGQLYLAMEYVRGDTLSDRLAELGPLSWQEAVAVGIQVGEVLALLHAAGVFHRDIKPSNIMLCSGSAVVIKVIDLGCAKKQAHLWPAAEGAPRRFDTELGVVVGTPHYRPPEAGQVPADPRLDVFGLAATIHELCTGKVRVPGRYQPLTSNLPPELNAVLAAALREDADARTPTMEALLDGLRRIRDAAERGPLFDGRYEILRRLGAGAKAEVVLAHHRRAGCDVALKILHASDKLADERERMRREARVLSLLHHPAFPALRDFHEHDGRVYLALEFVAGESAAKFIENPLRPAHVIEVGIQLARALVALSALGVVHRDIHKSNVLIDFECGPAARPVVKLIDLGMCELLPAFYARVHRYGTPPEERVVLGTGGLEQFAWTAPEAVQDRVWTEKCDVWSVGRLLYQLLTGRVPSVPGTYEPVSPREWVPGCCSTLEAALLGALCPDPANRSDAAQLLAALIDAAEMQAAEEEAEDVGPSTGPAATEATGATDASHADVAELRAADDEDGRSTEPAAATGTADLARCEPKPIAGTPAGVDAEPASEALAGAPPATAPPVNAAPLRMSPGGAAGAVPTGLRQRPLALALAGTIAAGAVMLVRALLGDPGLGPVGAPASPRPSTPAPALEGLVAQPTRPTTQPSEPVLEVSDVDMGTALDGVREPLRACARKAGRRVTVELSVGAGATRFSTINVLPAETADRCVRTLLEPLRFRAETSPSTFITRYQP